MKPGICLFTDSKDPSGVGVHMMTLASQLADRYRLGFVAPPSETGTSLLTQAAKLGIATFPLAGGKDSAYRSLRRWLIDERFTLFHVHAGIGWEGHRGVAAAVEAQVPAIVRTEHLPYLITDPWQVDEYRRFLPDVDRIICVSREMRLSYQRAGVPTSKLRVVRNAIQPATATLDRQAMRERLGVSRDAPLILTVGRLTEQKGYRVLAKAIPAVLERVPEARFAWVGDGILRNSLSRQLRRLEVDHAVLMLGRRNDVPSLLGAADLFVLPSLFEGLPLVVLEAMATGVPVIGTRVCGTSEAIVDGVTGRLVPARAPAALADAIVEAIRSPEQARRWAAAAERRVRRTFDAASMAAATARVYESLIARRPVVVAPTRTAILPIGRPDVQDAIA